MFNLGFSEIIILCVLALVLIGPKQLPDLARSVGRLLNEIKRAGGDMTSMFTDVEEKAQSVTRFVENRANKIYNETEQKDNSTSKESKPT